MIDLMKKSVYAAIGLAIMTRERVEDVASRIAQDAKMNESEGRKFVDELVRKSEQTMGAIEVLINEKVEQTLKKMNISTQKELAELERRVRKLEIDWDTRKEAK